LKAVTDITETSSMMMMQLKLRLKDLKAQIFCLPSKEPKLKKLRMHQSHLRTVPSPFTIRIRPTHLKVQLVLNLKKQLLFRLYFKRKRQLLLKIVLLVGTRPTTEQILRATMELTQRVTMELTLQVTTELRVTTEPMETTVLMATMVLRATNPLKMILKVKKDPLRMTPRVKTDHLRMRQEEKRDPLRTTLRAETSLLRMTLRVETSLLRTIPTVKTNLLKTLPMVETSPLRMRLRVLRMILKETILQMVEIQPRIPLQLLKTQRRKRSSLLNNPKPVKMLLNYQKSLSDTMDSLTGTLPSDKSTGEMPPKAVMEPWETSLSGSLSSLNMISTRDTLRLSNSAKSSVISTTSHTGPVRMALMRRLEPSEVGKFTSITRDSHHTSVFFLSKRNDYIRVL
jgi:hypothetical protein